MKYIYRHKARVYGQNKILLKGINKIIRLVLYMNSFFIIGLMKIFLNLKNKDLRGVVKNCIVH